MSQSGLIDVVGGNPQIPTTFETNSGSAIPLLNTLEILGINGVSTSGSGNTVTIDGGGLSPALTITGNLGGPISPSSDNWNLLGSGNLTVSGAGSTLTATLTGLTPHSVQVGALDGESLTQTPVGTDGQVLIGANGADPLFAALTSVGGTITFTTGANSLNLDTSGSVMLQIDGDTGSAFPAAGIINVTAAAAGTTATFQAAGNNVDLHFADSVNNVLLGGRFGASTINPAICIQNVALGASSLNDLTIGADNVGIGHIALTSLTSGANNTAVGSQALADNQTGLNNVGIGFQCLTNHLGSTCTGVGYIALRGSSACAYSTAVGDSALSLSGADNNNTAIGYHSLLNLNGGGQNTALGASSLDTLASGTTNIAIGVSSGSALATNESDNILIGSSGVVGDNNKIRIGVTGSGDGQQNECYIAGITGVTVSNTQYVTIDSTTGQLGVSGDPGSTLSITALDNTDSPYAVLDADEYLSCDVSGGVLTIQLPNAPTTGRIIIVKDSGGDAATSNITVTTVGGVVTIDGATSFVMNTNYQAANFIFNGTSYEVY